MAGRGNGGAEDAAGKTLKEAERILPPTRRPDGTLRKPVRIRPGYQPQDEVAVYQSKGAIWRKEMSATQEVPPGYDPAVENKKSKSKSAKRNEKRKEKRQQQAALDKAENSEQNDNSSADNTNNMESVSSEMNGLSLSGKTTLVTSPINSEDCLTTPDDQVQDIDKKIRALKKKIRLTEDQQQKTGGKDLKPEQLDKVAKLEGWRNELKLLEDKRAEVRASVS
ncbi:partner of y14 and mago [Phtheirospermum japonicum]|uniref:Partner of y14 and mago n=1 Tax=Phtheirospermum japonicum TaxID=374723 RepID=A0A830BLQ5_9LAMI|nr:partner of y14 and mago [Phtheirospermum japonicum]